MTTSSSPVYDAPIMARFNQGVEQLNAGRIEQAEAIFRALAADRPDIPEAHFNLGVILLKQQKADEAIAAFRAAVALRPNFQEAWNNIGVVYRETKRPAEAIPAYRQALALRPDLPKTWVNLALTMQDVGQIDEARTCYDRAIALAPNDAGMQSSRIHMLQYHTAYDAAALYQETLRWNQRFGRPQPSGREIRGHDNDRSPRRRLRIGYVSSDFRAHCQSLFTAPLLKHHDRDAFEIYCYSTVTAADAVTARIRGQANAWREIARLSDAAAAQLVRQDRIDILVDLSLHSAGNRLFLFALKPAPLQVTWLGYPGTTGMEVIDYRLTDRWLDPVAKNEGPSPSGTANDLQSATASDRRESAVSSGLPDTADSLRSLAVALKGESFATKEDYYSERSVRLPDSYWCYDPHGRDLSPDQSLPEPGPLPALAAGHVTFGCLNTFWKISDVTLALWSGVLAAVPDARLVLVAPPGPHRQRVLQKLGVPEARVEFASFRPWVQYLELYRQIDLCLDTLPFNGGTTSLDALWMGVPVVTRVGRTVVGRAGVSHLHNLGLQELVAHTDEEFVRCAAELARDLDRLGNLHATLRQRMEKSPLMDGPRFTRNVESAYRRMWQAWCGGK